MIFIINNITSEDYVIVTRDNPLISDLDLEMNFIQDIYKGPTYVEEQSELNEYYSSSRIDSFWTFSDPQYYIVKFA